MVTRVTGLIEDEVRAGDTSRRSTGDARVAIVRLAEAFLYNDADGLRGDVDRLREVEARAARRNGRFRASISLASASASSSSTASASIPLSQMPARR